MPFCYSLFDLIPYLLDIFLSKFTLACYLFKGLIPQDLFPKQMLNSLIYIYFLFFGNVKQFFRNIYIYINHPYHSVSILIDLNKLINCSIKDFSAFSVCVKFPAVLPIVLSYKDCWASCLTTNPNELL